MGKNQSKGARTGARQRGRTAPGRSAASARRRQSHRRVRGGNRNGTIAGQAGLERQIEELRLRLKKVQQEGDRYVDLFDFVPFGYFICNEKGVIFDANRSGTAMLGRWKREMRAMSFSACVAREDLPVLEQLWGDLFQTGKQQTCELRLAKKNGVAFLAKLECMLAEKTAGADHGEVRIIATDLSAIKGSQEALRNSEERYFALLDLIPHGINEVDLQGRIIYTNPAFAAMHGYERSELVGLHVWDLLESEKDKKEQQKIFVWAIEHQPPSGGSVCVRNRRKDGKTIDIQVDWSYRRGSHQKLVGFVTVITDITERLKGERAARAATEGLEREVEKRTRALSDTVIKLREEIADREAAQIAQRESEERFKALAQASNDIICLCDPKGKIVFANQAVGRLLGYEPEDVIQRQMAEFIHPEDRRNVERDFRAILKGRRVKERVHRLRKRDNTWLLIEASGFSCNYGNDRYVGAIVRDASGRMRQDVDRYVNAIPFSPREASLNGILAVGRNREILFFIRRLMDLWGLSAGVLQSGFDEPVLRAMAKALRNLQGFLEWAELYARPESKSWEEIELANGRGLKCRSSLMPGAEKAGRHVRSVRDITEIKETKRTLKIEEDAISSSVNAISSSVNAISFVDLDGRISYVNQAFLDMWGIENQEEVVGRDFLEICEDPAKGRIIWKIVMKKNSWHGRMTAKRRNESKLYVYMSASLLRNESGSPVGMMGTLVDISAQRKVQLALQESERRYRSIFEASTDGVGIIEKSSSKGRKKMIDCNESFAGMAGFSRKELLALPCIRKKQKEFIIPDSGPKGCRGNEGISRRCQGTFSWRRPEGIENNIKCRGLPIVVNGETFNLCVHGDNTQLRKAEEKIKNLLSSQLLQVAEVERKRIARDLHDEFGQLLPALRYRLESLQQSLPEAWVAAQHADIAKIADLIEKLGAMVRNISYDLRPSLLDDFGLAATIEESVGEFMNRYERIKVAFSVAGAQKKIFSSLEIVLYRVFQEAMNNVAKHARAQNVAVSLTFSYPSIILMVADDGVGFDTQRIALPKTRREGGIGLLGMRERIAAVDGNFTVRSEPGNGTLVRAEVSQKWKRVEDLCRHKIGDH
jgi:PAS domain S-box-containing protein